MKREVWEHVEGPAGYKGEGIECPKGREGLCGSKGTF